MKNNITKILFSMIFVIFIVAVGVSYAYFLPNITNTGSGNVSIKANNFNVTIIENNHNTGMLIPISDADYATRASDTYYTINATSPSGIAYNLKYHLILSQVPSMDLSLKWKLTDENGTVIDGGAPELISCNEDVDCMFAIKNNIQQTVASKNYHLYLWLTEDGTDQNSLIGISMTGNIVIEATTIH